MKYANLYLFFAVLLFSACNTDSRRSIEIPEGKVGLIGYGSLTSQKQMAVQLGKPYDGVVEVVHLEGYQRTWDATTPNTLEFPMVGFVMSCIYENDTIVPLQGSVLNIRENDEININCCFFIIDEEDLPIIDATEIGYKRIEVTDRIGEFDVDKGTVWAYQAEPAYTKMPNPDSVTSYVLPQLYLDFLEAGFTELGEDYRKEFYETTLPVPTSNVLNCYFE